MTMTDTPTDPVAAELAEQAADSAKVARTTEAAPDPVFDGQPDAASHSTVDDGDPTVLDFALLRRYRELREAQAIGEAEAKAYKDEANAIEQQLVEMFTDAGMQNINVDGKTIYLHRSTYAARGEGVEAEDVKAALRAAGAGDLVTETVNANTLSAYVRELLDGDDAPGLPEPLVGVLDLGERFSVRINAAGSRPKSKTRSK